MIACRTAYLAKCLSRADYITSSLEIGSNIGYNEIALHRLYPDIQMDVVEINKKAAKECSKIPNVKVHNTSVYDFNGTEKYDLTMVRDFAGEILEKYLDLDLLDYGFIYHKDKAFPRDDFNWVLLQKRQR